MTVRVRFAPSPTGFLHIGGVRTALFNWLYAKQHGGQFLLRIEDTDLERSEDRYTQDILSSMKWLGLTWDEEPLYQSKRMEIYAQKVEELIEKGLAYRCTCTEEEVEKMRERLQAEGKKPMYDRACRNKKLTRAQMGDKPFAIRLAVPLEGSVTFTDLIRGDITVANAEVDDFVLIRSNGAPTYNLSVVVDDVHSRMTHIIRGDDHINNTPKQIHLYNYFGYPQPKFAHLPMILGTDKKKLSKRTAATSTNHYRNEGFLPEALLNFLARLGWSHGDQEIFSIDEMIRYFSFDSVQKAGAVFNMEKLLWLNGAHIRQCKPERLAGILASDYADLFQPEQLQRATSPIGHELVGFHLAKIKLIKELADMMIPLCTAGAIELDAAQIKWGKTPEAKIAIQNAIKKAVEQLSAKIAAAGKISRTGANAVWGDTPSLHDVGMAHGDIDGFLRQLGETHGVKLGELAGPMRYAVTGRAASASLFELMSTLPWDVIESRLKKLEAV